MGMLGMGMGHLVLGALACIVIAGLAGCSVAKDATKDGDSGDSGAAQCSFEGSDPGGCEFEGWLVASTLGANDGSNAVHPPELNAGESVPTTFDCNGAEHTQLSFSGKATNNLGGPVDVAVDGKFWETLTFAYNELWQKVVFDVPAGKHQYTFTARADIETAPPFILDSFSCKYTPPAPSDDGAVDFDDGFIPVETGGDWLVTSARGANGEAAIHPPWMKPGDHVDMTFDCNGALSFSGKATNNLGGPVDVAIDGSFQETLVFAYNENWAPVTYKPSAGKHTYTFTARADIETPPPLILDSFSCQ